MKNFVFSFLKSRKQQLRKFKLIRQLRAENVVVGSDFVVGVNTRLWAPSKLVFGNDVAVGSNCRIEVDGEVGDHVLIANSSAIVGKLDHDFETVGESVRRADWIKTNPQKYSLFTRVGSDVWIGYGAIVLSGVTIGSSTVIAAGSIVTKDIPFNSIVVGNPARVIRQRFSEAELNIHWESLRKKGIRIWELGDRLDES